MAPRDLIDLLILGAIWGASFLFMRIAAPEFGPIPLITMRVGVAAAFLLPVLAWRGRIRGLQSHPGQLTLLGALNSAIPFTLFAFAVLSLTAGFAAVLNSTAPLFGALVAFLWLGEAPTKMRVAGLAVGFSGVVILVWPRLAVRGDGGTAAVLAGLSAAVLYGIAANYTKRKLHGVHPLVIATGSLIAATVLLLVPALLSWPAVTPRPASWLSAIVLGVVCTGVAYILYFRLLERVGAARTLAVTYLIPAFGVWWGYLFLDEKLTANMLIGCAVILLGTGLATGMVSLPRHRHVRGATTV